MGTKVSERYNHEELESETKSQDATVKQKNGNLQKTMETKRLRDMANVKECVKKSKAGEELCTVNTEQISPGEHDVDLHEDMETSFEQSETEQNSG